MVSGQRSPVSRVKMSIAMPSRGVAEIEGVRYRAGAGLAIRWQGRGRAPAAPLLRCASVGKLPEAAPLAGKGHARKVARSPQHHPTHLPIRAGFPKSGPAAGATEVEEPKTNVGKGRNKARSRAAR